MPRFTECPVCGKEIPNEGKFCPFCGNKIIADMRAVPVNNVQENEADVKIKERYVSDLKEKTAEYKALEKKKTKLIKEKQSIELKINNYRNLKAGKIPNCIQNMDAPEMTTGRTDMNNIWYVIAGIALAEILVNFVPWITLYYGGRDWIGDHSVSLANIFNLIQTVAEYSRYIDELCGVLYFLVAITVLDLGLIGINIFLLVGIAQRNQEELEFRAEAAGWGAILLSIFMFLATWGINSSVREESWDLISLHQEAGLWLLLITGIAMAATVYTIKGVNNVKSVEILNVNVTNFDPVLPIRFDYLKVRRYQELEVELSCKEFECDAIDKIVAEIQLIKGRNIETFKKNVTFRRNSDQRFIADVSDENYEFANITEARVNVINYSMYVGKKEIVELGSGYSVLSDYSAEDLDWIKLSETNPVFCIEKEFGNEYQCSCGQIYSKKRSVCPLCGKERMRRYGN